MPKLILDLKGFMLLGPGERHYKGYFIPGKPGWARAMISKKRLDGQIEALNFIIFTDNAGNLLWQKQVLRKVQPQAGFEQDLAEFKAILEEAGLLVFIEDYYEP